MGQTSSGFAYNIYKSHDFKFTIYTHWFMISDYDL